MKNIKICILGSYSGSNAGDSEILLETIRRIKKDVSDPVIYVPTQSPEFINSLNEKCLYPIKNFSNRFHFLSIGLFKVLYDVDMLITTSGIFDVKTLFRSAGFVLPMFFVFLYLGFVNPACKILGYYISVYPYGNILEKMLLRYLMKRHKFVLPRDSFTFKYLTVNKWTSVIRPEIDIVLKDCELLPPNKVYKIAFICSPYIYTDNKPGDRKELCDFSESLRFVKQELSKKGVVLDVYYTSRSDSRWLWNSAKLISASVDFDKYLKDYDIIISMRLHGYIMSLNAGKYGYICGNLHKNRFFCYDARIESQILEISYADYMSSLKLYNLIGSLLHKKHSEILVKKSRLTFFEFQNSFEGVK